MSNKKPIPIRIPNLGQQQKPFDMREGIQSKCQCGHEFFDMVYRLCVVSKMAPSNKTAQDITIGLTVYICRACGMEFGKVVETVN